jgi:hypothetical protein
VKTLDVAGTAPSLSATCSLDVQRTKKAVLETSEEVAMTPRVHAAAPSPVAMTLGAVEMTPKVVAMTPSEVAMTLGVDSTTPRDLLKTRDVAGTAP